MFKKEIQICESLETPFQRDKQIYQDGTTPMYRDTDGTLWAMSGHSHMGHIAMFKGTSLDDLEQLYPVELNFSVGHADFAYAGIPYPEGIKARGSIWPFGLYICPGTHRFFCFFHNETGWAGRGTAYDANGLCETPFLDSDFRHIGLMHSDDEGKTWFFDRWVVTAEHVAFTDKFNPGAGNVTGQKYGSIRLGSGDFTFFPDPNSDYLYIFYNILQLDMIGERLNRCDCYVARTRKRDDGVMGDFVKYYDGSFGEAGNFGKESMVVEGAWHTRVAYLEKYKKYIMVANHQDMSPDAKQIMTYTMATRFSDDLIHWSEPFFVEYEGKRFGNHYNAIVSHDTISQPHVIPADDFSVLTNHNATNVTRYKGRFLD